MSVVPADLRATSAWRTALPVFLLLEMVILLLYRDTAQVMVGIWWRSETFAHCLVVLPISLWLIWRQREQLARLTPSPQPWVLLPLLAVATAWLLADLVVVNAAEQFALVAMLVLAVPAVLGVEVTLVILFPLLFLFFGVPFGEFALPKLMQWTADFTVFALQLSGIPVLREGQHFTIPSGNWSVIDECSGVRYLMASFMVGTLFAYLNYRSYKRRAIFMFVSLLVPIVANWLRAYIIVMLAHLSGNKIATGVDHVIYGWVFFGVIIFIMFVIGARWSEPDAQSAGGDAGMRRPRFVGARPALNRSTAGTALAVVLIGVLPHLVIGLMQRAESAAAQARLELPPTLAGGWSADGAQIASWTPSYGNPSAQAKQVYSSPAGAVGVYIAYYRGQADDRKIVSSQNTLVSMRDPEWNLPVAASRQLDLGDQAITIRTAELLGKPQPDSGRRPRLLVWHMYWIDGRFIGSDAAAKIAGAVARLRGRGDEGAALVLYADAGSAAQSNATLEAFAKANLSGLDALLQRARDAR